MDPFVAEIRIFAGNFAPKGWAFCNGQILPISQNTALFSLLGTTYGGDGKSTFALPNLQGSAPMFWGQGPGLSQRDLGESGGSQNVTLIQSEIPAHTHTVRASGIPATNLSPTDGIWAVSGSRRAPSNLYSAIPSGSTLAPTAFSANGGSQPHNNMPPYLTLTFIIALQGVFPPRS